MGSQLGNGWGWGIELKLGSNSSFGTKSAELSILIADAVCFTPPSRFQNAGDFGIADAQLQPAT